MCKVILLYTLHQEVCFVAKKLSFVLLLDCYGDLLTEHQRNIMELYYCEDLSLAEIGQPLGITRQAVRAIIKRSEAQLTEYESKLGFAERLGMMRECLGNISALAQSLGDNITSNKIITQVTKGLELL